MRLPITFTFLVFSQVLYSQDLIVLEDGSEIHGNLISYGQNGIRILRTNGDTLVIEESVSKILLDNSGKEFRTHKPKPIFRYQMGFTADNEPQIGFGITGGFTVHAGLGYSFIPQIQVSALTGYEKYQELNIIPLAIELSGRVFDDMISPYYSFQAGTGFGKERDQINEWDPTYEQIEGGFRWSPSLGVAFTGKFTGYATLGIISQKTKVVDEWIDWQGNDSSTIIEKTYKRLSFQIGFTF